MIDYIDLYLRYLASRYLSPLTLSNYSATLYPFLSFLKKRDSTIPEAEKDDARLFLIELIDRKLNPITINHHSTILQSFYDWLISNEHSKIRNPFLEIKKQPVTKLLPVFCVEHEVKRLYSLIDQDNKITVQDVTMFDCFFSTGIRTSELCNLKVSDISYGEKESIFLRIRSGKGGKDREVLMLKFGWQALEKYLAGLKLRGFAEDWIFPNKHGGKLLRENAYKSIRKILSKVKNEKMGAHTLRHTFATYLMNNGTNIKGIQIQLGHASIATTQNYTHTDIKRLSEIHKKAHPRK